MASIPSISRSGGTADINGYALKDPSVQGTLRSYIDSQLEGFWSRYSPDDLHQNISTARQHEQENILIQLRKLREGIISSSRIDDFAIEVYELSFLLSIIFDASAHAESVSSALIPRLYLKHGSAGTLARRDQIVLIHLLQCLITEYPRQTTFHAKLRNLSALGLLSSEYHVWLCSLSSALTCKNHVRLASLTTPVCDALTPFQLSSRPDAEPNLSGLALTACLRRLRYACRKSGWAILRRAYREFSFMHHNSLIGNFLLIDNQGLLDGWVKEKEREGEIKPKQGSTERWVISGLTK